VAGILRGVDTRCDPTSRPWRAKALKARRAERSPPDWRSASACQRLDGRVDVAELVAPRGSGSQDVADERFVMAPPSGEDSLQIRETYLRKRRSRPGTWRRTGLARRRGNRLLAVSRRHCLRILMDFSKHAAMEAKQTHPGKRDVTGWENAGGGSVAAIVTSRAGISHQLPTG
jgi:hypothetical protein